MSGDSARRPFAIELEGMRATGINLSATNARMWNANVAPQPQTIIIIIIISSSRFKICRYSCVVREWLPPPKKLCFTRRSSVCLCICLLPTSQKSTKRIFMKSLPQMYNYVNKEGLIILTVVRLRIGIRDFLKDSSIF